MEDTNHCSECGEALSEGANFCHMCGALTAKGAKKGLEPYWGSDIESTIRRAILNIQGGMGAVAEVIDEAGEEINPQLEEAKERLQEILEDVGKELSELGDDIKKRAGG